MRRFWTPILIVVAVGLIFSGLFLVMQKVADKTHQASLAPTGIEATAATNVRVVAMDGERVTIGCDPKSGDKIYLTNEKNRLNVPPGIAVTPGGCSAAPSTK